jgi:hypothetical protein
MVEPELEALSVDPLIFGNVRETFAKVIRNGETVVSARAVTDEEVEFAAETLRQYSRMRSSSCRSPRDPKSRYK